MNIRVDEQFRTLIPALTEEEFSGLEQNILEEGIRDKLVVWGETLVDGHNRYRIATKHNLPYEVIQKDFESREHALNWIINNQLGRRNLTDANKRYLIGVRNRTEKKIVTNQDGINQHSKEDSGQNVHQPKTSERIGEEYGLSERTVRRYEEFADAVDTLQEDVKQKVLAGEEKITIPETMAINKMDDTDRKNLNKELKKGTPIKEAVKKVDPELKRKERDDFVRAEIQRKQEIRERAKFGHVARSFVDATVCSKQFFIENADSLPDTVEVWVFNKSERATDAKIILRQNDFKFN